MTVAGARLETPGIFLSYMKVSDNLRKIYTRGHGAHLTLSDPSFRDAIRSELSRRRYSRGRRRQS